MAAPEIITTSVSRTDEHGHRTTVRLTLNVGQSGRPEFTGGKCEIRTSTREGRGRYPGICLTGENLSLDTGLPHFARYAASVIGDDCETLYRSALEKAESELDATREYDESGLEVNWKRARHAERDRLADIAESVRADVNQCDGSEVDRKRAVETCRRINGMTRAEVFGILSAAGIEGVRKRDSRTDMIFRLYNRMTARLRARERAEV